MRIYILVLMISITFLLCGCIADNTVYTYQLTHWTRQIYTIDAFSCKSYKAGSGNPVLMDVVCECPSEGEDKVLIRYTDIYEMEVRSVVSR